MVLVLLVWVLAWRVSVLESALTPVLLVLVWVLSVSAQLAWLLAL